jgi:AbiU2
MTTNFKDKEAKNILKDEALDQYKEQMGHFHKRLAFLHHNIYFLQHIADFPVELFIHPVEDMFLRFVGNNFIGTCILQITKLTTDSGKDLRTLRKFRNLMVGAVKEEYQEDYKKALREVKFKKRTEELIKKAKDLRDTQIAHAVVPPPGSPMVSLSFNEVKEIAQELTKLFDAAAFSTEYRYLSIAYDPLVPAPTGCDPRPDIERILDSIARESATLNLPESNPVGWPHSRQSWSPRSLEVFNRYRRKLGMPEA